MTAAEETTRGEKSCKERCEMIDFLDAFTDFGEGDVFP